MPRKARSDTTILSIKMPNALVDHLRETAEAEYSTMTAVLARLVLADYRKANPITKGMLTAQTQVSAKTQRETDAKEAKRQAFRAQPFEGHPMWAFPKEWDIKHVRPFVGVDMAAWPDLFWKDITSGSYGELNWVKSSFAEAESYTPGVGEPTQGAVYDWIRANPVPLVHPNDVASGIQDQDMFLERIRRIAELLSDRAEAQEAELALDTMNPDPIPAYAPSASYQNEPDELDIELENIARQRAAEKRALEAANDAYVAQMEREALENYDPEDDQ